MKICTCIWDLEDDACTVVELLSYIRLASLCSVSPDHGARFGMEIVSQLPRPAPRRIVESLNRKGFVERMLDGDEWSFHVLERNAKWLTCGAPQWYGSIEMVAIHPVGIADGGNPRKRQPIPPRLRAEVIERDGMVCGICNEYIDGPLHIDHIYPIARGGLTVLENLQPAHPRCNMSKGSRLTAPIGAKAS